MTEEATAFIPLWALIFTCFGFMIGWALGDEVRRRRNAEEKVDELRDRLDSAGEAMPARNHQLKEMRSVLNDAHRLIHAVSTSLEKRPS